MSVVDLVRRGRVHAAIMFCGQAKSECNHDEDDDSLFLPSQNESLLGWHDCRSREGAQNEKETLRFHWGEAEASVNTPRRTESSANCQRPSGELTSLPGGGVNSNVDAGIGARVWFE